MTLKRYLTHVVGWIVLLYAMAWGIGHSTWLNYLFLLPWAVGLAFGSMLFMYAVDEHITRKKKRQEDDPLGIRK